jgi:hypothetical protein
LASVDPGNPELQQHSNIMDCHNAGWGRWFALTNYSAFWVSGSVTRHNVECPNW